MGGKPRILSLVSKTISNQEQSMNKQPLWDKTVDIMLDYSWGKFERATQRMMDIVDVQPWTHAALGTSLWFTISYLKSINLLFLIGWVAWAWYWSVIITAIWRTGYR
jgi:hypothetical protein